MQSEESYPSPPLKSSLISLSVPGATCNSRKMLIGLNIHRCRRVLCHGQMLSCCFLWAYGRVGGDGKSCRCHCLISLLLTRRKWGRWMNKKILKNIEDTFTRTLLDCNCRQQWSVKNIVCCKVSELRCGIVWNTFVAVHRQVFAANVCTRHNFREACWKHPFGDAEIRGNNRVLWFHVSVKEGFWSTSQVWSRD